MWLRLYFLQSRERGTLSSRSFSRRCVSAAGGGCAVLRAPHEHSARWHREKEDRLEEPEAHGKNDTRKTERGAGRASRGSRALEVCTDLTQPRPVACHRLPGQLPARVGQCRAAGPRQPLDTDGLSAPPWRLAQARAGQASVTWHHFCVWMVGWHLRSHSLNTSRHLLSARSGTRSYVWPSLENRR